MSKTLGERIIAARRALVAGLPEAPRQKAEGEGGCGVLGLAASFPVQGRHLFPGARQMHNRGNGKGGGLAAAGLSPAQMGVAPSVLREATLLQVAYLDDTARREVERESLGNLEILQGYPVPALDDYRDVPGLAVRPPEVWRYFVRVKPGVLDRFAEENALHELTARQVEDEFIYQNSFRLNQRFYASLGDKRAFVLSHGRDLAVFKVVGYAEQAAAYYRLEELEAHVWIAHQRYPTKGRVWHPAGAHPFVGLNEALVHNGDLANYHAVATYLRQRNIVPLFLTDTEVGALLFDLLDRVYAYPTEALIEALAPTTERDLALLPPDKQRLFRAIQATHSHAAPDGPWFFIIAQSRPDEGRWRLLGITDTSMLRPQVFALLETATARGEMQIGLIASEKQAIDATLESLHAEDPSICPVADRYWAARGGSATDGGAFVFTVERQGETCRLACNDKFGRSVTAPADQRHSNPHSALAVLHGEAAPLVSEGTGASNLLPPSWRRERGSEGLGQALALRGRGSRLPVSPMQEEADGAPVVPSPGRREGQGEGRCRPGDLPGEPASPPVGDVDTEWRRVMGEVTGWDYAETARYCRQLLDRAAFGDEERHFALQILTRLRDLNYDPGPKRRASILALIDEALGLLFGAVPLLGDRPGRGWRRIDWAHRRALRSPGADERVLAIDVAAFPPEGEHGIAPFLVAAYRQGWRQLATYGWRGQRFCGCGLGPGTGGLRIDVYGSSGDYLGSGLDGAEIHVHGSAQDQVGQILKAGRLVIHGDVGQAFLYGAKGGEAYVRGSAAGRPLINAVGRPRVVINGTCLDYLAESFMAGDPLAGGGFVVVNGVAWDDHGRLVELPTPYPGANLFSLASGGAIYARDPHRRLDEEQLNGGCFAPFTAADWALIRPYLEENSRLFGLAVEDLLTVEGHRRPPEEVYRKVAAIRLEALA